MPEFAKAPVKWDDAEAIEIPPNGLSIDLLRAVYRNKSLPLPTRMRAAMACLKHEVPVLMATAVINEKSFAELLEKRLQRQQQMELAQLPKPAPQIETKPQLSRTPDKRYRRI